MRTRLVKSVLSAPVPLYALLTISALSAQTVRRQLDPTRKRVKKTRTVTIDKVEILMIVNALFSLEHARFPQLLRQHPFRNLRLYDVGAIEAVHAVGPEGRLLRILCVPAIRVEVAVRFARFMLHLSGEGRERAPLLVQVLIELIQQLADPIKSQPTTLVMKIEVDIVNFRRAHGFDGFLKAFFDGLLVAGFVDEVDKVLIAICLDLMVHVQREGFGLYVTSAPPAARHQRREGRRTHGLRYVANL